MNSKERANLLLHEYVKLNCFDNTGNYMLKPGLCTVTFKDRAIDDVVLLAAKAGLQAIECAGISHVEPGDLEKARQVKALCKDNGIEVPSYGSYYRIGVGEKEGMAFESILENANELGCDNIRVWAGDRDFGDAGQEFIDAAVEDTFRIAKLAKQCNVTVSFEFHKGSLTDTNENAVKFANMVKYENVRFYWQPPIGCSFDYCMKGLKDLSERLSNVHIFHWTIGSPYENVLIPNKGPVWPDGYYRHNLTDGKDRWIEYLTYVNSLAGDRCCFLEFVKDDSSENLIKDATALINMIDSMGN